MVIQKCVYLLPYIHISIYLIKNKYILKKLYSSTTHFTWYKWFGNSIVKVTNEKTYNKKN